MRWITSLFCLAFFWWQVLENCVQQNDYIASLFLKSNRAFLYGDMMRVK